jgi:hypothetical protein
MSLCTAGKYRRSYWIPGSYAPTLSKNRNSFLKLLKNKGFKEEGMTKVGLYAIGKSTTLESNKSQLRDRFNGRIAHPLATTSPALSLHSVSCLSVAPPCERREGEPA